MIALTKQQDVNNIPDNLKPLGKDSVMIRLIAMNTAWDATPDRILFSLVIFEAILPAIPAGIKITVHRPIAAKIAFPSSYHRFIVCDPDKFRFT